MFPEQGVATVAYPCKVILFTIWHNKFKLFFCYCISVYEMSKVLGLIHSTTLVLISSSHSAPSINFNPERDPCLPGWLKRVLVGRYCTCTKVPTYLPLASCGVRAKDVHKNKNMSYEQTREIVLCGFSFFRLLIHRFVVGAFLLVCITLRLSLQKESHGGTEEPVTTQ